MSEQKNPPKHQPIPLREDRRHPANDSAHDSVPSKVQPTQEWPRPSKKEK